MSSPIKIPAEPRPLPTFAGDDDDEESFVVLGTSSSESSPLQSHMNVLLTNGVKEMQELLQQEIAEVQEQQQSAPTFTEIRSVNGTPNAFPSPEGSLDIQKQIEELIKENEKLKNTVAQNNFSMKAQHDRIMTWKDDVENTFKEYKTKLQEAKSIIDNYKKEHGALSGEVEKYKELKNLQDEEIMKLKDDLRNNQGASIKVTEEASRDNLNEFELQIAKNKILDLEKDVQTEKVKYSLLQHENEDLLQKLQKINDERADKLQKACNEEKIKNVELVEKIERLTKEFAEEKDRNCKLSEEIENVKQVKFEVSAERQQLQDSLRLQEFEEFKTCINMKLAKLTSELSIKDQEIVMLKSKGQATGQAEIAQLMSRLQIQEQEIHRLCAGNSQLHELQLSLHRRDQEIQELSQHLNEKSGELISLQNFHADLSVVKEKNDQLQEQLRNSQRTITAHEQELRRKVHEIEELRKLVQESTATIKSDEMFALTQQLEVYKADYEAEKESKKEMKRAHDQVADDLKNLHRRNKELQEEIEICRERGFVVYSQEPKKQERAEPSDKFECPKCNFQFKSYQALENHVHRCLDLDGFP